MVISHRYGDWYQDAPDPMDGAYRAIYKSFAATTARTTATLLGAIAQRQYRYVVAYLGQDDRVHAVHRMERHVPGLETQNARHANEVVGILDEVNDYGANFVAVSDDIFDQVVVVNVPAVADIAGVVTGSHLPAQVDIEDPAAASTVSTRVGIVVPHPWVPALLRGLERGPVTPAAFWGIAQNLAEDPNVELATDCKAFVDWARVIVAGGIGAVNPLRIPNGVITPVQMDASLGAQRASVQLSDFPAESTGDTAAQTPIIEALVALGAAQREDAVAARLEREVKAAADAAAKTSPTTLWGKGGVARLCNLCQVPDEDSLPPIYAQIVSDGVKHVRATLESAARREPEAPEYSLSEVVPPVVSADLARAISLLKFLEGEGDIVGGLSIFAVSFANQADLSAVEVANSLYDHQVMGNVTLHVSDLKEVQKAQAIQLPRSWFQLHRALSAHHRMLQLLLGEGHLVPVSFHRLLTTMSRLAVAKFEPKLKGERRCAEIMSAIQTYTWVWVEEQQRSAYPVRPMYDQLAAKFQFSEWAASELPPRISALLKPEPGASARAASGENTSGGAKAGPVLSPPEHRLPGVFHGSASVRTLLEVAKPPKLPNGSVPCLNYHVRGSCRPDCPYVKDHRLHTDEETAVLKKYVGDNLPKTASA